VYIGSMISEILASAHRWMPVSVCTCGHSETGNGIGDVSD